VKPVWIFGIDRNVQNSVGHEAYGQYQALFSFSIIFQIFLDFGLQSYNNRTVAQSPKTMRMLFPNIIWAKALLSLIYFLLIAGAGAVIGYRGHVLFLLILLSFVQILNSFLQYLRSNVSAMHWFKTDSILSVSDRLFMIAICGVLLFSSPWKSHFKIEWFIYAQIAAYFLSMSLALIVCLRMQGLDWGHFNIKKAWVICKKSLPYAILIFSMAVYQRADSILLERILPNGKEEAGVFAASFRLLDVANNVTGVLFAGILLPLFGRLLTMRAPVQPIVRQSVNLLLPVAFTTLVMAWLFGREIMFALYTEATAYDGRVLAVLMCAFPGFCIGYIYSTLLTAHGSIRQLILISLIAVALNLTLNFMLIPYFGALGAASSCAVTQIVLSGLNLRLATRLVKLRFDRRWAGQHVLFILLMTGIGLLIHYFSLSLWMQVVLMAANGGIVMMICGFVPINKIRAILEKG
jgi:O-antigen/teichoic acid export membrane protein